MTWNQNRILTALDDGPLSAMEIADAFGVSRANRPLKTAEQVRKSLRRMEDHGWVRRTGFKPTIWGLTQAGRDAAGL